MSRCPTTLLGLCLTAALALALTGCGAFQRRTRPVAGMPVPAKPAMVPTDLGVVTGRIAVVNPQYRFVVVDFGGHRVPSTGTSLSIRRDGKTVGTVRLTEPSRGALVSADVLTGEPRVGDEIR